MCTPFQTRVGHMPFSIGWYQWGIICLTCHQTFGDGHLMTDSIIIIFSIQSSFLHILCCFVYFSIVFITCNTFLDFLWIFEFIICCLENPATFEFFSVFIGWYLEWIGDKASAQKASCPNVWEQGAIHSWSPEKSVGVCGGFIKDPGSPLYNMGTPRYSPPLKRIMALVPICMEKLLKTKPANFFVAMEKQHIYKFCTWHICKLGLFSDLLLHSILVSDSVVYITEE